MQEVPAGTPSSEVLPQYTIGGHHDKGDRGTGYQSANFVVTQHGEGTFKFITLQASIEDTIGLNRILNIPTDAGKVSLLTEEAWRALLLVDFWNPIYSWRRGVLMAYVPKTTAITKKSEGPVFDLEAKFKAAVQESTYASTKGSPERTFLELYAQFQSAGDQGKAKFDDSVTKYCEVFQPNTRQPAANRIHAHFRLAGCQKTHRPKRRYVRIYETRRISSEDLQATA